MIPNIIDGTYRLYEDGREECLKGTKGRREYQRRREQMADRQGWICGCGCGERMSRLPGYEDSVTFQHDSLRGKDIDERIVDEHGNLLNCAMRADCNLKLGSVRRLA